jgi:hypothetical protein
LSPAKPMRTVRVNLSFRASVGAKQRAMCWSDGHPIHPKPRSKSRPVSHNTTDGKSKHRFANLFAPTYLSFGPSFKLEPGF